MRHKALTILLPSQPLTHFMPLSIYIRAMNFHRFTLLSICLLLDCFAYAQNFDWVRTINGNYLDECTDVTVSQHTGFIYTTGYFNGSADFQTGNDTLNVTSSYNCAFVGKYNTHGDLIWLKTLASPIGKSNANGIALDEYDNVIVVGGFDGTVDFDPSDTAEVILTESNSDAFVWKLDKDGNYQWVKKLHSSWEVSAYGVTADTSNNIVFSGLFTGSISMFGDFNLSDNDNRGYICKLDSAGEFVWVNALTDIPGDIYPSVVRSDTDNNYYVTGAYVQNSSPTIGFLQKVTSTGEDSWRVELGNPSGVGFINDVVCTPYGVFACGSFKNQATIGGAVGSHLVYSNGPFFDAVVFKLLPGNGQPIWSTVFGSSADDSGSAIHRDANGNVYVAGRFKGTANYANIPQATITANGSDVYVWKLGYDGEGMGAYTLTNPVADEITATAICTSADGAIYVSGRSYGTTDFDHDLVDVEEHTAYGYSDGFLHRTTDCDAFVQPPTQQLFFCQGDSIEVNGVYYDAPLLIATDSLISQWGCDSITTVQISNHPYAAYDFYSICRGDSIIITAGLIFEAGEYVTDYTSSQGCDSSLVEFVEWIPSSHIYEAFTLCQDSVLNLYNETITAAGEYTFLIENVQTTCLDTVSASVTLVTLNSTVSQQGNTLIAEEIAAGYTWLDCTTNEIIIGATGQQLSPTNSGSYAVIITDGVCESTGPCFDIEIVGVDELASHSIEIYPNPARDVCYIQSNGSAIIQAALIDSTGKAITNGWSIQNSTNLYTLSLFEIPSGIYTLILTHSDQTTSVLKIAVN
jgi:hypothetical protein